jgi:hypothetical protein
MNDVITILVPVKGCLVYTKNTGWPAFTGSPTVTVTTPTNTSAGTINISIQEPGVICGMEQSEAVNFPFAVSVGRLFQGEYTINYPAHSLSLDISVVGDAHSPIAPQQGLWAITSEVNGTPGRGFQVELHGGTMVVTFYGYDASGRGRFWLASGTYSNNYFLSRMMPYDGGTSFGGPTQVAAPNGNEAAPITLQFISPTTGTITLPNESPKSISYFQF